jgi:hypothetical protein
MENFFDYIESKYSFKEQQDLMLIDYAAGDSNEALRILKDEIEKKKKKLFFHYPGLNGEINFSVYNVIGTIPDGVLLIEK